MDSINILRILLIIRLIPLNNLQIRSLIYLVGVSRNRSHATRAECFPQGLWELGKVSEHTKASERLPEDRPSLEIWRVVCGERFANRLGVFDNAVCTEELEVISLAVDVALEG